MLPQSLRDLIDHFQHLPGIGPRQAARFVFALLRHPADRVRAFGERLAELPGATQRCQRCFRIMESSSDNQCSICRDPNRDTATLCIVINDLDLEALEETESFQGHYHVLGGHIDPVEERKNQSLTLKALRKRLAGDTVDEVIIATDSTTEGDTTALALTERIHDINSHITVSRLGRGLSTGSEIEYMDPDTLRNALERRITTSDT